MARGTRGTSDKRTVVPNGQRIRELRQLAGYSLEDFAEKSGISTGTLGPVERRNKPIFVKKLHEIVEILNSTKKVATSYQELLLSIEDPSKQPAFSRGVFQLPPSLPDFTGREDELARITERLGGGGGSVGVSSALRGMGGIGKTVTAIEACWEVKDNYPDGQLVIELRGMSEQPLTPVQAMSQIIRDFHPGGVKMPDDEHDLQVMYRQVLEGKKALVLLDNAKDENQVRELLRWAPQPPVAFVVTSRRALALEGVSSILLGVLPPEEAFVMLRGIVGAKGNDNELRTVAELCGWLPLALRVAGCFLHLHVDENWPLPKYIEALQDESKRLERLKGKTPDRDVEAVLALSARELVRENPTRAELWQMLSVFPAGFKSGAAAAVWDLKTGDNLDTDAAEDELTALLDSSLVQFEAKTDHYSLHDLMRPIAREAFGFVDGHPLNAGSTARIATAELRFAGFYCRLLAEANDLYLKGNRDILHGLAIFGDEEVNILRGQAWAVQHRLSEKSAIKLCRDYGMVGTDIIGLRFSDQVRISWLEVALAACREIGDRRGEGTAQGNLGIAWKNFGDARRAITCYEEHLAIAREIGDSRGESAAFANLGAAWAILGDTSKAISIYEQAYTFASTIGEWRFAGTILNNLGIVHKNLGDARKAIDYYKQALDVAREIGDQLGEGKAMNNWSLALMTLGDSLGAISLLEKALAISRAMGDRRGEGSTLGNLGIAHYALSEFQQGIEYFEQHIAVACEIGDRRGEATSTANMSRALHDLGQSDRAIQHAEHALELWTQIEDPRAEQLRQKLAEWRREVAS